jgi:hypothetical protein
MAVAVATFRDSTVSLEGGYGGIDNRSFIRETVS